MRHFWRMYEKYRTYIIMRGFLLAGPAEPAAGGI
jgi:hypothetical protein